jgi:hypothetical protein
MRAAEARGVAPDLGRDPVGLPGPGNVAAVFSADGTPWPPPRGRAWWKEVRPYRPGSGTRPRHRLAS